ncbi:MAG TPA: PAS and helix-turn-helix domain-containing protein [Thermoanaerobaculia bacterium]
MTGIRGLPSHHEELAPMFRSLELSPDAVFVSDRRNRIVFWNDSARRLLGFEGEDALGADCSLLLCGSDVFGNRYCSESCPVMRAANRGEIVRNFTLAFQTKESRVIMASVSLLQLRTESADDYYLLHILRPVVPSAPRTSEPETPPRPRLVDARGSADVRAQKLTAREVEVLGMIAAGRSTPEIADRLHISQLTTRSHIQNILEKLEVHSKAEAVAFAFQKNLI